MQHPWDDHAQDTFCRCVWRINITWVIQIKRCTFIGSCPLIISPSHLDFYFVNATQIRRCLPDVLLASMNILYTKYRSCRSSGTQSPRTRAGQRTDDGGKETVSDGALWHTVELSITRSLWPRNFICYIRYLVISVVNNQDKTKEINSLGPEKFVVSSNLLYQISLYQVSTVFVQPLLPALALSHCGLKASNK